MKISDLLSMCFRNLFRRKVRTLLTVSGVIIGTCSIVVMISLGVGLNELQEASINEMMDLSVIEIYPGGVGGESVNTTSGDSDVKLDDKAVEQFQHMDNVLAVTPVLELSSQLKVTQGKYVYGGGINAVDMDKMELFGYELTEGHYIEGAGGNSRLLFGEQAVYSFYDPNKVSEDSGNSGISYSMDGEAELPDPPFDPMRAKLSLTVVNNSSVSDGAAGATSVADMAAIANSAGADSDTDTGGDESGGDSGAEGGGSAPSGNTYALSAAGILKGDYSKDYGGTLYSLYIDIDLAKKLMKEYNSLNGIKGTSTYSSVKVKVRDVNAVDEIESAIQDLGYETYSASSIRDSLKQMTNILQLVLGGIGAISLLVAALGITNTMVMSIYERTREIGVMKVLGCRLQDIRGLFLTEAGAIGLLGGILGIILSYMISFVINVISKSVMAAQGSEVVGNASVIPLWLVLLGVGIAIIVALAAGFYPANRAVRISALSAIRQE